MALNSNLIKALLAASGAAAGYIVANAANFGKYELEATVFGTIIGYFINDILQDEFGSTPASTASP
jgi:hypothetical protein